MNTIILANGFHLLTEGTFYSENTHEITKGIIFDVDTEALYVVFTKYLKTKFVRGSFSLDENLHFTRLKTEVEEMHVEGELCFVKLKFKGLTIDEMQKIGAGSIKWRLKKFLY